MTDTSPRVEPTVDVETFRQQARSWLAANLEIRDPSIAKSTESYWHHQTAEGIAAERVLQRLLYEGGFAGITVPFEYGGRGLSDIHERVFNDEASAYRLPDFGMAQVTTFNVCLPTMLAHASPDFLQHHVPRILRGDALWCQFFSEPEAGSDLAGVRSRAVRDGEGWILNGAKVWSSGAYYSDYGMCLVRTNWDVPKHQGLTWFAVATDARGVTVRPIIQIDGEAEFCEEFFDDVHLSTGDVIGEVDRGWSVAQTMFVFERGFSTDPESVSAIEVAPDLVALARQTHQEKNLVVRQLIAEAHTNDYALAQLKVRLAGRMQSGLDAGLAAYGKLAVGMIDPIRAAIGIQVGGPASVTWLPGTRDDSNSSTKFLNSRKASIAGGTNEVQRNGIGERVLGLPREPSFDTNRPFSEVVRAAREWSGKTS
jgi:alkylation response protein AidB-like acyl-CoA dehydrogenase